MTTTERPSIQERYITAEGSSEVIAAAALASIGEEKDRVALALLLWDVTYKGKSERQKELADKLGVRLNKEIQKQSASAQRMKGDAWKIAKEMLAWHLHGICTTCDGRGYEQIKDTPSLSSNMCHACHGTGKRPYPREAAHTWMVDYLGSLTAIAGGEVMKRLRVSMEL